MKLMLMTLVVWSGAAFAQGPLNFAFDGNLEDASGNPILSPNAQFRFEIWDANETCKLYSEEHLLDLSGTGGHFAVKVGTGTSRTNLLEGGSSLSTRLFMNYGSQGAFTNCAGGVVFNPGSSRRLKVSYDIGSGFTAFSPSFDIGSVPFAIAAESLQGRGPADFAQIRNDGSVVLTQANLENVFSATNYPTLTSLLDGTSSLYMRAAPSGPVSFNSQRLTGVAAPTAFDDATNKNYVDSNLGGKQTDFSSVSGVSGDGYVVTWDQATMRWEARPPTSLSLSGGTMSGMIQMGANDIQNVGYITMADARYLHLGRYTNSQQASMGLSPTHKGAIWYNTDTNEVMHWDGSTAQPVGGSGGGGGGGVTSVNGQTGDVTLSAGDLGLGMAATRNVGISMGELIEVNSLGKIDSMLIPEDSITSYHINSGDPNFGVNRLLITDSSTGNQIKYATCAINQYLAWTATGWACTNFAIPSTGVSPGTYGGPGMAMQLTVSADGRLTNVQNNPMNQMIMPAGSSFEPAYSFAGETSTGMFRPTNNTIAFSIGSMEAMRITSSKFLGIGTQFPTDNLHVVGDSASRVVTENSTPFNASDFAGFVARTHNGSYSTSYSQVQLMTARGDSYMPGALMANDTVGAMRFIGYTGSGWNHVGEIRSIAAESYTPGAVGSHLAFNTATMGTSTPMERMRITHDGNVGIGTISPNTYYMGSVVHQHYPNSGAVLSHYTNSMVGDQQDRGAYVGFFHMELPGTSEPSAGVVTISNGSDVVLGTNNSPRVLVKHTTGNVGIGTVNPQAKLHVQGAIVSKYETVPSTTIDWSLGNVITYTGVGCDGNGGFSFTGMVPGGVYRLIIENMNGESCTFSHGGLIFRYPMSQTSLNIGADVAAVVTFVVSPTYVYIQSNSYGNPP